MAQPDDATKTTPTSTIDWQNQIRDVIKGSSNEDTDDAQEREGDGSDDLKVKTAVKGAEAEEDDDSENEGNDGEGEGDDADEDETDLKDKGSKSEFRFTQFKGDGKSETYLKNLEEGYANSYGEYKKVKDAADEATTRADAAESQVEAIKTAVAEDPEFGKKVIELLDAASAKNPGEVSTKKSTSDDPFITDAKTRWNEENDKSVAKFAELNPEVVTDPILADKVKKLVTRFGQAVYEDEKRLAPAGELMEKAYRYLGLDVKKEADQNLADAMKGQAAPTRKQSPKKPKVSTKQFSDLTTTFAKKMNISADRLQKFGGKR